MIMTHSHAPRTTPATMGVGRAQMRTVPASWNIPSSHRTLVLFLIFVLAVLLVGTSVLIVLIVLLVSAFVLIALIALLVSAFVLIALVVLLVSAFVLVLSTILFFH